MSPSEKYKSLYQTRPTTPQNNADLTRPKTLADLMRERNSNATTPKVETVVEPEEKIPSKMFIGSDSISMPKPSDLSQSTLSEGERLLSDSNKMIKDSAARSRESLRQNFLFGEFLFGKSEDEYLGTKLPAENVETGFVKGLVDSVKSRGVIKFLQKNNLMQEAEKTNEYAGELMRQGNSKSDAITKSREYYAGNSNLLNDSEKTALKGLDNTRVLWGAVEVLDLFPIFKYARTTLGATYIRDVLKTDRTSVV